MMEFKIGDTFHIFKGIGKPYKAHVVAIVDSIHIVYKYYGRHKQRWHYSVKIAGGLQYEIDLVKKVLTHKEVDE